MLRSGTPGDTARTAVPRTGTLVLGVERDLLTSERRAHRSVVPTSGRDIGNSDPRFRTPRSRSGAGGPEHRIHPRDPGKRAAPAHRPIRKVHWRRSASCHDLRILGDGTTPRSPSPVVARGECQAGMTTARPLTRTLGSSGVTSTSSSLGRPMSSPWRTRYVVGSVTCPSRRR